MKAMTVHFTSREFNQDLARAKRAARKEPVIISDRGKPAHVLLSYQDYQRLGGRRSSIGDLLSNPEVAVVEFDPPRLDDMGFAPATFD